MKKDIKNRLQYSLRWIPSKLYLQLYFFLKFKRLIDFKNPKSFNEKLQWLKLYDHNPVYARMVDKYEAKKFIADIIGGEYIIPTLGIWDRFDDIDFDTLPEQFVLKCTHDSGTIIICSDRSQFDIKAAQKKINRSLKTNYYYVGREYPYKLVKPRIIAEKFMIDESGYELKDYKFFCFDGEVKALYVAVDRQLGDKEMRWNFYDERFELLPFWNAHPNSSSGIKKPESFDKMRELACKLSNGLPHVRVDFYNVNGHIYFGELTLYHNSGMSIFHPQEWDYKFGEWLKLPKMI